MGHDPYSLSKERTFDALTVQPLVKAIEQANMANKEYVNNPQSNLFGELQADSASKDSPWWNGFYSLGVGNVEPLQVLIDIKNNPNESWPAVVKALEPLRKRGFLTRYKHGKIIPGPIITIGTGATPLHQVIDKYERDVFYDCQLDGLHKPPPKVNGKQYHWNNTLCPIASADFKPISFNYTGIHEPSNAVKQSHSKYIHQAHKSGIKTRFWDTPAWPKYARNRVNRFLLEIGSDWINADDLKSVALEF